MRLVGSWIVLLLLGCGGGEGSSGTGGISVEGAWVRAMPALSDSDGSGGRSAVYLHLKNVGDSTVWLVGGSTPVAAAVEVHESRMEGDVMRMRQMENLPLPPGETIELSPGGLHLMLLGLTRSLLDGEEVELTLRFEGAPDLAMTVPVRSSGSG